MARPGGSPLKYLLWLIPLLVLLMLWNMRQSPPPEQLADVTPAQEAGAVQRLEFATPVPVGPLSDDYIPESAQLRAEVLQNLNEFRAAYRQLAPSLEVRALPGLESRRQLAERLGSVLSHHGLGQAEMTELTLEEPLRVPAPMLLRCARDDVELVHRLLRALSPYLSGAVLIQFDDSVRVGELRLYLLGKPRFSTDGVAVFQDPA